MKSFLIFTLLLFLASNVWTQKNDMAQSVPRASKPSSDASLSCADDDRQQLSSDLQQLKVLVNQMRTNLGFVQLAPTPLKHQFELEADAWQVIIKQMEQRLQKMDCGRGSNPRQ
jgi:hypothetical protein